MQKLFLDYQELMEGLKLVFFEQVNLGLIGIRLLIKAECYECQQSVFIDCRVILPPPKTYIIKCVPCH